jgi:hypothetical protein
MAIGEEEIHITSLVSSRTKEGVVQLNWGDKKAQFSAEEARKHALRIIECAEAAETDAFIVDFFVKELNQEFNHAVRILVEFRAFRDARSKENIS